MKIDEEMDHGPILLKSKIILDELDTSATLEIKSGYGLSIADELKMLNAMKLLKGPQYMLKGVVCLVLAVVCAFVTVTAVVIVPVKFAKIFCEIIAWLATIPEDIRRARSKKEKSPIDKLKSKPPADEVRVLISSIDRPKPKGFAWHLFLLKHFSLHHKVRGHFVTAAIAATLFCSFIVLENAKHCLVKTDHIFTAVFASVLSFGVIAALIVIAAMKLGASKGLANAAKKKICIYLTGSVKDLSSFDSMISGNSFERMANLMRAFYMPMYDSGCTDKGKIWISSKFAKEALIKRFDGILKIDGLNHVFRSDETSRLDVLLAPVDYRESNPIDVGFMYNQSQDVFIAQICGVYDSQVYVNNAANELRQTTFKSSKIGVRNWTTREELDKAFEEFAVTTMNLIDAKLDFVAMRDKHFELAAANKARFEAGQAAEQARAIEEAEAKKIEDEKNAEELDLGVETDDPVSKDLKILKEQTQKVFEDIHVFYVDDDFFDHLDNSDDVKDSGDELKTDVRDRIAKAEEAINSLQTHLASMKAFYEKLS
jgi:hypothetical protein